MSIKLKEIVVMKKQDYLVTTVYSDGSVDNSVLSSANYAMSAYIDTKQRILHGSDMFLSVSLYIYNEDDRRYDLITSIKRN